MMKIVYEDKGNKSFKITIDTIDNEIRAKIKKDSNQIALQKFKTFVEGLLNIDFSEYPVLRGKFSYQKESILLETSNRKHTKYPIEIRVAENGFPYIVRDRYTKINLQKGNQNETKI